MRPFITHSRNVTRPCSWFAATLFMLSGCGGQGRLQVVLPENLGEGHFVVLPPNASISQIAFADRVEELLLAAGMRVAKRPTIKEVEASTRGSAGRSEAEGDQGADGKPSDSIKGLYVADSRREFYMGLADTPAQYIVQTYEDERIVKIVQKETRQVLAIFNDDKAEVPQFRNLLDQHLEALGFKVTVKPVDKNAKPSKPPLIEKLTTKHHSKLVVLPANDFLDQITFANGIERLLLEEGLFVHVKPGVKEVETTSGGAAKQAEREPDSKSESSKGQVMKERFFEYEDVDATHLIHTYIYEPSCRIRIVEKSTGDVKATVDLRRSGVSSQERRTEIMEALRRAGVPIEMPKPKELPRKPEPKATEKSGR